MTVKEFCKAEQTPAKQFEFAVKDLEKKGWGFMGWKDGTIWYVQDRYGEDRMWLEVINQKTGASATFQLATVLLDLPARKLWFGEEYRITQRHFDYEWHSQQMISKGELLKMLDYVVKFLKKEEKGLPVR